jgi:hypothetical protein
MSSARVLIPEGLGQILQHGTAFFCTGTCVLVMSALLHGAMGVGNLNECSTPAPLIARCDVAAT